MFACAGPGLLGKTASCQDGHDAKFILMAYRTWDLHTVGRGKSDFYYENARDVFPCSSLCLAMVLMFF